MITVEDQRNLKRNRNRPDARASFIRKHFFEKRGSVKRFPEYSMFSAAHDADPGIANVLLRSCERHDAEGDNARYLDLVVANVAREVRLKYPSFPGFRVGKLIVLASKKRPDLSYAGSRRTRRTT